MGGGWQLSFGSVEAIAPAVADLAGLLVGPGHLVEAHGMARVSTLVGEQWRVDALVAELEHRGLAPSTEPIEGGTSVRTTFTPRLLELLALWTRGAVRVPPRGLGLDGRALRLWCISGGAPAEPGELSTWQLRLATDPAGWPTIGAALAAAGLTPVLVGPRADGPAYRLAGTRRVRRLAELVGEAPPGAPCWPA